VLHHLCFKTVFLNIEHYLQPEMNEGRAVAQDAAYQNRRKSKRVPQVAVIETGASGAVGVVSPTEAFGIW
jgi:hypothetical protein